jgi:hypothetical protein
MTRRHVSFDLWLPDLPGHWRAWLPNRGNALFTLLLIVGLLWAQSAGALPLGRPQAAPAAASTGAIAYQGRLADANGNPLTGTYNMIFRLYAAPTGGAPLWEEQWTGSNGVKVSDGLFNVMLGSLTPIQQSTIAGHDQLWLGITVGTDDEMQPRVQLGSVPFAVQALTAPDGSVTTAKIADGAVTQAKLASDVNLFKVQSGRAGGDWQSSPGWNLHQGFAARSYTVRVTFQQPFQSPPTVLATLYMLDVGNAANTRVSVSAENITTQGFDLVIYTWGDTALYGAYVNWLAYVAQ